MIEWLSGWYNWLYLLSVLMCGIFITLNVVIGSLDSLLDLDVEVDAGDDVDAGWLSGSLYWMGAHSVPTSIIIMSFTMLFGLAGLLINFFSSFVFGGPFMAIPLLLGLPVAFRVAKYTTRAISKLLALIAPEGASSSREAGGFVGEIGTVVRTVTSVSGQIRIPGTGSSPDHYLNALLDKNDRNGNIATGAEVAVIGHNESTGQYVVTRLVEN